MASDEIVNDLTRAVLDNTKVLERILRVQEEMLAFQKLFKSAKAAAAPSTSAAAKPKREKGELLTVTGMVRHCSRVNDAEGDPVLTKKGGQMWSFELDNGFKARLFKEAEYKTLDNAMTTKRTAIISYEKNGEYNNIEKIQIGAAKILTAAEAEEQKKVEEAPW